MKAERQFDADKRDYVFDGIISQRSRYRRQPHRVYRDGPSDVLGGPGDSPPNRCRTAAAQQPSNSQISGS